MKKAINVEVTLMNGIMLVAPVVYASTYPIERRELWDSLVRMS